MSTPAPIAQPSPNSVHTTSRAGCHVTSQTTAGSSRHCQNSRTRTRLAASTYVLRSMGSGTMRVHHALNAGRAITLCCSAKSVTSTTSMSTAQPTGATMALSTLRGTSPPTKPIEVEKYDEEQGVAERAVHDGEVSVHCSTFRRSGPPAHEANASTLDAAPPARVRGHTCLPRSGSRRRSWCTSARRDCGPSSR